MAIDWPAPVRRELAHRLRYWLHRDVLFGMPRDRARARLDFLLAMVPDWPRDPIDAKNLELLRSALGFGASAISRLEALLQTEARREVREQLLIALLELCQVHQDVARGWPLFDRFAAEHLATATPQHVYFFHRHWTAMQTQVGTLDAAEASLQAAAVALRALHGGRGTEHLPLDLQSKELDLWLAAERFDRAEATATKMLADAKPDSQSALKAMLARALIAVRTGRRDDAVALLVPLAARQEVLSQRAAIELALLHARAGDLDAARAASAAFNRRPLTELGGIELVAVARISLLARTRGEPPLHPLPALDAALQAELDRTLARWRGVPPTATGVPFLFLAGRRDLLATLAALRLELHGDAIGAERGLQLLLLTEALGSTARTLGLAAPDLPTVRDRLLPTGGLLLAWLPAPSQSFVFGLAADRCFAIPLPSDAGLRDRVRALRRIVEYEPAPGWEERLATAARPVLDWCLPAAVRERMDAHEHIAIVGRELCAGIPFEALPYDAAGVELGASKAIWSTPSMTLLSHYASRPARRRDHDVAVLAATAVNADEQARYGTRPIAPDLARWREWTADDTGRGVILAPAGASDLLRGAGASARIAVVLAHGILDLRSSRPSGLLLGPRADGGPGTVLADDITAAADLVLLLVCNAASGPPRRGEDGGHHLGGSLLRHGAQAVVIADQELELHSTVHWAEHFLASFRAGASVAEAARDARAAVRRDPRWRHPWFHASLHADGLAHKTTRELGPLR